MTNDRKRNPENLPATASSKRSAALDRIRNATPTRQLAVPAPRLSQQNLVAALTPVRRPRLVFAFDATASREEAWERAQRVTDSLFSAVPGQLDVALAVHGGSLLHTFTEFSADPGIFRDRAAAVTCMAGSSRLVTLMKRVLEQPAVKTMIYIGDHFEESPEEAYATADQFFARGIRAVILHDTIAEASGDEVYGRATSTARDVFKEIARRTRGAYLDFYGTVDAQREMRDILEAVAVLAYGGVKLLEQKRAQLPGAPLLLRYLG